MKLMKTMHETLDDIKREQFAPIYVLLGTENFFVEQFKRSLTKSLEKRKTTDITNYDLEEIAIQDVIVDVETLPFFTEHKIIYTTNPYFLTSEKRSLDVSHNLDTL